MKELSIEQKAEAYDEAIKRIQSYVVDEYGCTRIKVVNVFPELKESEDENIIKHNIIEFIKRNKSPFAPIPSDITLDKWIAWLEKQDEKPKVYQINGRLVVASDVVEAIGIYKEYYASNPYNMSPEIESVSLIKDRQTVPSSSALIRKS